MHPTLILGNLPHSAQSSGVCMVFEILSNPNSKILFTIGKFAVAKFLLRNLLMESDSSSCSLFNVGTSKVLISRAPSNIILFLLSSGSHEPECLSPKSCIHKVQKK